MMYLDENPTLHRGITFSYIIALVLSRSLSGGFWYSASPEFSETKEKFSGPAIAVMSAHCGVMLGLMCLFLLYIHRWVSLVPQVEQKSSASAKELKQQVIRRRKTTLLPLWWVILAGVAIIVGVPMMQVVHYVTQNTSKTHENKSKKDKVSKNAT